MLEYVTAGPVLGVSGGAGAGVWALYRDHQIWFIRKLVYDASSQSMKFVGADTRTPVETIRDNEKKLTQPVGPSSILSVINENGDEIVHVGWPSYDNRLDICPSPSTESSRADVEWWLARAQWSSTAGILGGWQPGYSFGHDTYWPRCIGAGTRFFKNTVRPVIAVDPVSRTVWGAHNANNLKNGSEIRIYRLAAPPANTFGDNILSSTMTDTGEPLYGVHDQWGPTLAILHAAGDELPTIAVTWHDTRDDPANPGATTSLWGGFSHSETKDPVEPIVFSVGRITPLSAGPQAVPWPLTDFWGRYGGIVAAPVKGDFLVAWSDNRGGGKTAIWTSRIAP